MHLFEDEFEVPATPGHHKMLRKISEAIDIRMRQADATPIRVVVTESSQHSYRCEVGAIGGPVTPRRVTADSILRFVRRPFEDTANFNVAHLVPTGIGAEIGGHAGDAAPTATLLASVCDTLVTHPNVVNASDVIDIPENALYVEGSVISRLLMGTVGLRRSRANRLLLLMDAHQEAVFNDAAVNAVSAARASYGLRAEVIKMSPPMAMAWHETWSGRQGGRVEQLEALWETLDREIEGFDAVAITSIIDVPPNFHTEYYESRGEMPNPWGGVEALLTHAISSLYDVPSAHAPMLESEEIANLKLGVVDPRMAAEVDSLAFLQCVLKGLQRSPQIVTSDELMTRESVMTVENVSCLVIPDGCIGLPTLAALEQGIPVVAVRENENRMRNDLSALPWSDRQFYAAENYWEAAGIVASLRAGIAPESVKRPLRWTRLRESVSQRRSESKPRAGEGRDPAIVEGR